MLITPEYAQEQQRLHNTGNYGVMGLQYGELVSELVEMSGAKTLLDYGCGSKRSLSTVLNCDVFYQGYDPGVEAFSKDPDPADLVVCIDVLEHIEPECLDDVLAHLRSKCKRLAFVTIHTGPAAKTLKDGRNAHLIQETERFWLPKLLEHFRLIKFQARQKDGFEILMRI
jgi:cyclopropane fatty-acyl-phospholipid synthase-like methyltransferase